MPTINGRACVIDGKPVDKVFSNGVQVYGRNLLTGASSDLIVDDSSSHQGWRFATVYNDLIAGSVYTFSSEVSVLGTATSIDVRSYNPKTDLTILDSYTTFSIVDGKISGLVKPIDGYTWLIVYAGNAGHTSGNIVTFHHRKLEKGSIATPWSPALEDVIQYRKENTNE